MIDNFDANINNLDKNDIQITLNKKDFKILKEIINKEALKNINIFNLELINLKDKINNIKTL